MEDNRDNPTAYGSAHDLPSSVEMREMLASMKSLGVFSGREQRHKLAALEARRKEMFDVIDQYYDVLGARHWIFTDTLPIDEIGTLLADASEEEAEAGLMRIIAERLGSDYWQMGLLGHDEICVRRTNLARARQHYVDRQWDSSALLVVTVMDGFVNDIEPAVRRGLYAREPGETVAWDSVVGHHKGLTAVMPVFLKPCYRREDEEVFEVHRHGMVHGTIVNYNNQVVATKAWNMLYAVVDWATAKRRAAKPPEPKPTWKGTQRLLAQHAEEKRYRENFKSWEAGSTDAGFWDLPVVRQATSFLDAWRARRWGLVAGSLPSIAMQREWTSGRKALFAKEVYEHVPLTSFEITSASFPLAGSASVQGTATIEDRSGRFEIRWLAEGADGEHAKPEDEGAHWVLAVFPPHSFMKDGAA